MSEALRAVEGDLRDAEKQLESAQAAAIEVEEKLRRRASGISGRAIAEHLRSLQSSRRAAQEELDEVADARTDVSRGIFRRRAKIHRLKEAVSLRLHFTGLEVTVCPCCDSDLDDAALEEARTSHRCRLCGKAAHPANPHEVASLEAYVESLSEDLRLEEDRKSELGARFDRLKQHVEDLTREQEEVQVEATRRVEEALPTNEENESRADLHEEIGRLKNVIASARLRLGNPRTGRHEHYQYIVEKVKDVLSSEAHRRNEHVLRKLSEHTQELVARMGAESISDIQCSALGTVKLLKHGDPVSFSGIQNPGERLRVKLAFFLTLMLLEREPLGPRHPGLLLMDQPGTAEIVPEDFRQLAAVLRKIDQDLGERLQVLCFTARPEFREATQAEKNLRYKQWQVRVLIDV